MILQDYDIEIDVNTAYIPDQSQPDRDHYVFAYTITITNQGRLPARLMTRHWIITDANNQIQEVEGEGVVGEKPYLEPGDTFQYTSGTVLATPAGTMEGKYHLIADDGTEFDAIIPTFGLSKPGTLH